MLRSLITLNEATKAKSEKQRIADHYKGKKIDVKKLRQDIGNDLEQLEYSPQQITKMVPEIIKMVNSQRVMWRNEMQTKKQPSPLRKKMNVDDIGFLTSKGCLLHPILLDQYNQDLIKLDREGKVCLTPSVKLQNYHLYLEKSYKSLKRKNMG